MIKIVLSVLIYIICGFVSNAALGAPANRVVLSTKNRTLQLGKTTKRTNNDHSANGWLVTPPVNKTIWQCLINQDLYECTAEPCKRGLIRLFQDNAKTDSESTLKAAEDPDLQYYLAPEGYVTPCFNCGDPETQGKTACDLSYASIYFLKRLWFNIQDPNSWSTNTTDNIEFIKVFVKAAQEKCQIDWPYVGIFTNQDDWVAITGNSTEFSSNYVLSYTHIDGKPTFDDFKPFGGWTKETVLEKLYLTKTRVCGIIADRISYLCSSDAKWPCDLM